MSHLKNFTIVTKINLRKFSKQLRYPQPSDLKTGWINRLSSITPQSPLQSWGPLKTPSHPSSDLSDPTTGAKGLPFNICILLVGRLVKSRFYRFCRTQLFSAFPSNLSGFLPNYELSMFKLKTTWHCFFVNFMSKSCQKHGCILEIYL